MFQAGLQKIVYGIAGVNLRLLLVAGIGFVSFLSAYMIPTLSLIPDILVRSSVAVLVYISLTYFLKVSIDLNQLIREISRQVLGLAGIYRK
jgi:hypothetical protein